ncbi:ABC transporter ATPase [Rossellomorea marisflavi]|uniref:ABC transporter ATPase n=1 Tax=Rossellomorea marisflavi TaxID=189381 RepID=UPI0035132827
MAGKLTYNDFHVLREPLENGRQSPSNLAAILLLGIPFLWLFYYVTYSVAAETTQFPQVEKMKSILFGVTLIVSILCLLFAIPLVYKKFEWVQYVVNTLFSQLTFCVYPFLIAVYLFGEGDQASQDALLNFTYIALAVGIAIFLITCIRFYLLIKKGAYRENSYKGKMRNKFEISSYLPIIIVASTGLALLMQYAIRTLPAGSIEDPTLTYFALIISYLMIFVLPEQLVLIYCKLRFKAFNFNSRGYLYDPEDEGHH